MAKLVVLVYTARLNVMFFRGVRTARTMVEGAGEGLFGTGSRGVGVGE